MKICMILPKGLPVPAVKGGAIETLVNDIVDRNEKEKLLDITVASVYDEEAERLAKTYSASRFIFVKKDFSYILTALWVRVKNLFGKDLNTYNEAILNRIKKTDFDYIVVEDGGFLQFESYLRHFKKEQMIVHFHHNHTVPMPLDRIYSTYIGVSNFVAENFRKVTEIKDIQVLKNGIKTENFLKRISAEERLAIRKELGFSQDDFIVVFCGRLVPQKGVLELAKAVNAINDEKIKLLIVGSANFGDDPEGNEYISLIHEEIEASNGRISATGFVHNSKLYKYHQIADMGAMPSTYEDPAPLSFIELQASGLPTVITRTGGAPEYAAEDTIIIDKDGDVVEALKENILQLYNSPDLRTAMAASAERNAARFNTETFYKDFVDILRKKGNE